jgi:hypothetical protein
MKYKEIASFKIETLFFFFVVSSKSVLWQYQKTGRDSFYRILYNSLFTNPYTIQCYIKLLLVPLNTSWKLKMKALKFLAEKWRSEWTSVFYYYVTYIHRTFYNFRLSGCRKHVAFVQLCSCSQHGSIVYRSAAWPAAIWHKPMFWKVMSDNVT